MIVTLNTLSKACALVSFILATLCLFAGTQKSILHNASVMLLDTSASKPTLPIQSANKTAADLGLRDFYAIHVLTYCEGNFAAADNNPQVTKCSKRTAPFAFRPTEVFASEFNAGYNISDIDWPMSVTDDFNVMQVTTKAMSVIYIIGVVASGTAFLMEILFTQFGGNTVMFLHLFLVVLSFVSLGVSSSVASVIATQFTNTINEHGRNFGITARAGHRFLGMTWAAMVLSLLAASISVITLPVARPPVPEKHIEEDV